MSCLRVSPQSSVRTQQGAALVTALLLLLVMTILAVSVMQMSRVEERMVGNTRDINVAFEAAEAAVRNGEALINKQVATPAPCTTACTFWTDGSVGDVASQSKDWWAANATPFADAAGSPMTGPKENPRYVVEHVGQVRINGLADTPPIYRDFYQVTGRSTGSTGLATTVVQTTFARKF